ncbi:MAG: NAD(P)-dependent oxidoreductase, partial [Betaproteobacteria bacterium]
MPVSSRVAFLGLGVMGGPMAGHLARAGHHVTVFNRTQAKSDHWAKEHSQLHVAVASSPARAAENADLIFACVGNDQDLRNATVGPEGAFSTMKKGAVFIDHTTASAEIARDLGAAADEKGLGFLDAPVSGGQAGAVNGTLTVMVGGNLAHFEHAKPVAMAFSKAFTRVGPHGSGQLAKIVNQLCVAGVVQSLAEGIAFGQKAGLD